MPTTTEEVLGVAFRPVIEALAPREITGRLTHAWKFYEGDEKAPVRSDARWFRFRWDDQGYTEGGMRGPAYVETSTHLAIVTDYGGVPAQRVRSMATDDRYQLRDVLNRLKSTVPGFRWLEAIDKEFTNADLDQARIAHIYLVRYMKARA